MGQDNFFTAQATAELGWLRCRQGRHSEGLAKLEQALENCQRQLGPDNYLTKNVQYGLAYWYPEQGSGDRAEPLLVDLLRRERDLLGEYRMDVRRVVYCLAHLARGQGEPDKARELLDRTLAINDVLLEQLAASATESTLLAHLADVSGPVADLMSLATEHPDQRSFTVAATERRLLRRKGIALDTLYRFHAAQQLIGFHPEIQQQALVVKTVSQQLAATALLPATGTDGAAHRLRIRQLQQQLTTAQEALGEAMRRNGIPPGRVDVDRESVCAASCRAPDG